MGEVVRFAMAHGRSHLFTLPDGSDLWIGEPATPSDIGDGWALHEFSRSGDSGFFHGAAPSWAAALSYAREARGIATPVIP